MKKTDIFDITIRLFGLYFFIHAIFSIKDLIIIVGTTAITASEKYDHGATTNLILVYCFNFVFQLLICCLLIFKSKFITDKLIKPDSDVLITVSLDRQAILELASIIAGGLTLTFTVSKFGQQLVNYVAFIQNEYTFKFADKTSLIFSAINIIIGLVLIVKAKPIATLLAKNKNGQ